MLARGFIGRRLRAIGSSCLSAVVPPFALSTPVTPAHAAAFSSPDHVSSHAAALSSPEHASSPF